MKLIYQHMLGFLLIILTTVSIIGYSEINYVRTQAYDQNFARMEGYAESLGQLAANEENNKGSLINSQFLNQLQFILNRDRVTFQIFTADNLEIYPANNSDRHLPKNIMNSLKRGNEIRIRNNQENEYLARTKNAYTGILMPWFSHGKFIGVIWIGSMIRNVEKPIIMAKKNLINALIVTLIVGLILSYLLSYYSISKIKKLSKATKKVAAGNFDVHLSHDGNNEIDQLAANFNRMVRKLKQSKDEVQAQEERRDQFMADAAHEMRTPLTTINGILEGLEYDAIPESAKPQSIALMKRETNRLIRLVNENLDYEKIRNNQIVLTKIKFNATPVLEDLKTQLEQNANKVNDKIICDSPKDLEIYADRDRFTQIMVNLIQNAIQFTHDGKIIIKARRLAHAAEIKVIDNGIGMNEEQLKYIFERFFKADPSRAKMGTGESGLGLSIVASLIKQHGGKISVYSRPGKGSTFTVTIFDKGYEQYQV